jgi:hypothetical protein
MQHDIGKIWLDLKLLLKGTVSPDIGLYFRFWKKNSTSCRTACGYNIFYLLVPEISIFELLLWKHSPMVQILPKAVPESTFRLTDFAVRTPAGFSKPLVNYFRIRIRIHFDTYFGSQWIWIRIRLRVMKVRNSNFWRSTTFFNPHCSNRLRNTFCRSAD